MSTYPQKVRAAVAAQRNSLLRAACLMLGLTASAVMAETSPSPTPSTSSCELLSRGPDVQLLQQEASLHSMLQGFLTDLRAEKYEALASYFHSRARAGKAIGDKIQAVLNNRYDAPLQYSVLRVWRLRTPDGKKSMFADCPENQDATLISQFGHERQFAIWIQIMGQNELGRMILAIAPDKSKMAIVGFRLQQWTQGGSDWETWSKQAQALVEKKDAIQAYFSFDIAQKLLNGEDFLLYRQQKYLLEARDQLFSQSKLVELLNERTKSQSIAYVGSLLTKEGSGILLREFVSPDESTQKLQDNCKQRAHSLQEIGWLKPNQGLRCNYIVKGMDPNQDSPLGGFYFSPSDLKNPQK